MQHIQLLGRLDWLSWIQLRRFEKLTVRVVQVNSTRFGCYLSIARYEYSNSFQFQKWVIRPLDTSVIDRQCDISNCFGKVMVVKMNSIHWGCFQTIAWYDDSNSFHIRFPFQLLVICPLDIPVLDRQCDVSNGLERLDWLRRIQFIVIAFQRLHSTTIPIHFTLCFNYKYGLSIHWIPPYLSRQCHVSNWLAKFGGYDSLV